MEKPLFVPLTLTLIDEGRFLELADADLADLQRQLINFAREHGEAAVGAKADLTIKISLAAEDGKGEMFSIKAQTTRKVPARPASTTTALAARDQTGVPSLFVRESGSDASSPRQGKFCTDDGRPVPGREQVTGNQ